MIIHISHFPGRSAARAWAAAIAGVLMICAAGSASAQSAISIGGTIRPGTCNIATGDINKNVQIDPIEFSDLPASGELVASRTNFDLSLSGCAGVTRATVAFTGNAATPDSSVFANSLTGADAATGVAIRLNDRNGGTHTQIPPGGTKAIDINGATGQYTLSASVSSLSGVTRKAGDISTSITATITFE